MKLVFKLFPLLFCNLLAVAQTKTITLDYSSNYGVGKKMTGVNTGPHSIISGTTEQCLQSIGTELVRTHDYHGPCDYYSYSTFFDFFNQTFDYTFQTSNPADYNWTTTNTQIDEIVNANLQPFYRLGISFPSQTGPSPLSPMPIDNDGVNFHTFAGIAKRTAMHYTGGWDAGYYYTIPYWEVWNEPSNGGSWSGTANEYYRMYEQTVDSIKSFNPNLKVGGPGAAKSSFWNGGIHYTIEPTYVTNFLAYCQTNSVPLDFYSFHMYDRKNPYNLRILTDTLTYFLNQYGFVNTELIISETNINTGGYDNTSKGCSHLASELISVANTRLSKFIWYRGVDLNPLCNADAGSTASLTLNGYAYKFFNELNDSTPNFMMSNDNEFDGSNLTDSLNNLMILSGKNTANDLVKVMISNHESIYNNIDVVLQNLPWTSSDQILITTDKVTSAGFATSTNTSAGSSTMNLNLPTVTDASVYLITLKKQPAASVVNNEEVKEFSFYPNPASTKVIINTVLEDFEVTVTNLLGQVLIDLHDQTEINTSEIPEGVYLISLRNKQGVIQKGKLLIKR